VSRSTCVAYAGRPSPERAAALLRFPSHSFRRLSEAAVVVPGRPDDALPLVELSSPSEFLGPPSSAFVAPSAPPSPVVAAGRGVFLVVLTPGTQGSRRPSRGVRLPFRVLPLLRRPLSFSAPSAEASRNVHRARDPPSRIPAPTNAITPGAPVAALRRDASRWAKVADPSPVPSSGFLPLSTVLAALRDAACPSRGPP